MSLGVAIPLFAKFFETMLSTPADLILAVPPARAWRCHPHAPPFSMHLWQRSLHVPGRCLTRVMTLPPRQAFLSSFFLRERRMKRKPSKRTSAPPTSTPNTTRRVVRLWPINSGFLRSFHRRPFHFATPSIRSALRLAVQLDLCVTEEAGHPPPLPVSCTAWLDQVQVSEHHVRSDRQTLATALSNTPARTLLGGGRRPSRRRRATLNNWGGIFVSLLVGHVDNANPAPRPPWDLTMAILATSTRVKTSLSLKCDSTREAESSGSRDAGVTPSAKAYHARGSKSHTPVNSLAAEAAASKHDVRGTPSNSSTIN